jgi:hypothetical protein
MQAHVSSRKSWELAGKRKTRLVESGGMGGRGGGGEKTRASNDVIASVRHAWHYRQTENSTMIVASSDLRVRR